MNLHHVSAVHLSLVRLPFKFLDVFFDSLDLDIFLVYFSIFLEQLMFPNQLIMNCVLAHGSHS